MKTELNQWLLDSDEPWTRYRTLVDLLDRAEDDAEVRAARKAMLAHPQVKALIAEAAAWGEHPITRHNDAGHALSKLSTLADFGVKANDRGMSATVKAVMSHRSPQGAFQSPVNIPEAFGGTGQDMWTWILCDAPTLLYSLLAMGRGDDPRVRRATDFRKLKYPFVWYDILHVAEVLSHFPFVHGDRRFQQMVKTLTAQADKQGRYTATSMYKAWAGWSFADKKAPSAWLTFLVLRILKRINS